MVDASLTELELRLHEVRVLYERVRERTEPSRELDFVGVYLRRALAECDRQVALAPGRRPESPASLGVT